MLEFLFPREFFCGHLVCSNSHILSSFLLQLEGVFPWIHYHLMGSLLLASVATQILDT